MEKTHRLRRTVTMLMAVLMVVSLIPTSAFAAEDISSHWAIEDIMYLKDKKIVIGDENGNINPDAHITRAEFVTMVNRAFGYTNKATANFPDINANAWYADEFLIAKQAGYVRGDEKGNATPDRPITRAEVAVIFARILDLPLEGSSTGFADQEEIPEWAAPSIVAAKIAGLITGYPDNTFRAGANLTRAEGFTLIARILRAEENNGNDDGNDGENNDDGNNDGEHDGQGGQKVIIGATGHTVEVPGAAGYSVNYALVSMNITSGITYKWNGASINSSKVSTDGKTAKIEIPAGSTDGTLTARYKDETVLTKELSFTSGKAAPDAIYGTVPMSFSEFYHDVTASSLPAETTTFTENAAVATPEKFITGGTRTGGNGTDTYAVADAKSKVDTVSSATYGDSVHYVPNKNLTLNTGDDDRKDKPPAGEATEILGITKVEVEVSFDLYANAALLDAANRETAQSENVIAQLDAGFVLISIRKGTAYMDDTGADIAGAGVYAPKKMLVDGNWGSRAATPVDATAVKNLPGEGVFTGETAYGGNWGDYLIDCSFVDEGNNAADVLGTEYAGQLFFDNFIEYMYAGYIEDEEGNVEPLVFLQQLFSHRGHLDFDVAISPSRFARFDNLTIPGEYTVTVLVWGFEDVKFTFEIEKELVNVNAAIAPASAQIQGTTPVEFTIRGLDNADEFIANAELYKGNNPAGTKGTDYELTKDGYDAKLTITAAYLGAGNYWGAHSLRYEDSGVIYKNISFNLINGVAPTLEIGTGRTEASQAGTEADPIQVIKADGKIFFSDEDFTKAITIGARGGSNFRATDATASAALANGTTFVADNADSYIDLSNAAFEAGKTYVFTIIAAGFNAQTYYVGISA